MYSNKRKFGDIYFGGKKKKVETDDGTDISSENDLLKSLSKKGDKESKIERDNKKGWDWVNVGKDMEKVIKKFEELR